MTNNQPSLSNTYCYQHFISFDSTDAAGIVFFGHVFTLAHQAFEQFVIQQLECPWSTWFQNPEWIVPIKHTEAQYFAPLQAGQGCQIQVHIIDISTTSFTVSFSFHQRSMCCVVKTVHVFVNKENKQKMTIPSFILDKLRQIASS